MSLGVIESTDECLCLSVWIDAIFSQYCTCCSPPQRRERAMMMAAALRRTSWCRSAAPPKQRTPRQRAIMAAAQRRTSWCSRSAAPRRRRLHDDTQPTERYYTVSEALQLGGVRYTCVPECAAPISEPLKQMLWIKGIDAARVVHPSDLFPYLRNDTEHAELVRATSQSSWPVLWVHDERPRSCWLEQLELVERIGAAGAPRLLPRGPAEHAETVGYIHLMMGERGLFWMRRLLHRPDMMQRKYAHEGDLEVAEARVLELLRFFDGVLERQERNVVNSGRPGSKPVYLVGNSLSAADVYWAVGAAMLIIHPDQALVAADDQNAYNAEWRTSAEFLRGFQGQANEPFQAAITDRLRLHQDMVIRTHCKHPLK